MDYVGLESSPTHEKMKHILLLHFAFNEKNVFVDFHIHTFPIKLSHICNLALSSELGTCGIF